LGNIKLKISPPFGGYFFGLFVVLFVVCFLLYIEKAFLALFMFVFASIFVLMLSTTDKIVFDGRSISRTGIFPRIWAYINGQKTKISLDSINQIETSILLTLKKTKKVSYIYKTVICSFESCLVFASSINDNYRAFMKALVSGVNKEALDFSSLEISRYTFQEEKVLAEAKALKLFPDDSTGGLQLDLLLLKNRNDDTDDFKASPNSDEMMAKRLRNLANELKVLGYLPQALEAFRRALALKPKDTWLHFEYSRCLQLFAESEKDGRFAKKARAYLRLSRIHGRGDAEILTYIAEAYLQYSDLNKARKTFQMALERKEENYRALLGLAEIALREGKIASVIHYLTKAQTVAKTDAFREWTSKEIAYFAKLNSDLSYVEKEMSRIGWLEKTYFGKKLALWIFLTGFPLIVLGTFYEQSLGAVGWTLSTLSLLGWIGLNASASFLTQRTPL
jgi:tetratricopeptide (TPR) repeat protein